MAITARSESVMEHKIISISSKRQITIPQKYFEVLGFDWGSGIIRKMEAFFFGPSVWMAMNLQNRFLRI